MSLAALDLARVTFGLDELNAAAEAMRPRPVSSEPGWLVWAVAPDRDGRTVTFRDWKRLAPGLAVVVAEGVVPLYARRADGSVLNVSGVPLTEPLPPWLVDELGGRWRKPRAAA